MMLGQHALPITPHFQFFPTRFHRSFLSAPLLGCPVCKGSPPIMPSVGVLSWDSGFLSDNGIGCVYLPFSNQTFSSARRYGGGNASCLAMMWEGRFTEEP